MFSQIVRYSAGHFINETLKAVSIKKTKAPQNEVLYYYQLYIV
jgi:hypothetical protein